MQKSQRNTQKHLLFSTEYNISSYIKHTTYKNENIQLTVADIEHIFSARTTSKVVDFEENYFPRIYVNPLSKTQKYLILGQHSSS